MNTFDIVAELWSCIEHGLAQSHGSLTLVPLSRGAGVSAPEYLLAADAFAAGSLEIGELDGGVVPNVVALNHSQLSVLLIDGEHLEGAKQSRVMNASALIAPMSRTVLPVSCVEQGRWGYNDRTVLAPSPDMTYGRLRRLQSQGVAQARREHGRPDVDQADVWADVHLKHMEAGVAHSASGAMRDAYESRREELDALLDTFERPTDGQIGVIACVSGQPVAVDIFDKPETLGTLWPRLISAYAMDALGAPQGPLDDEAVARLVDSALKGRATAHPGIGLGTDLAITGERVVGNALTWEDGVVHLALFATEDTGAIGRGEGIASPNRRLRHFHGNGGG